jgi:DNA mismatch repair protein MutL
MSKIKLMPIELANMIAAGEVIERPSSVIKELVENAIDAEAKNIEIQIFNAGKDLIAVKDDGVGMDRIDAELAFKRHASSKIKSVYDLARITTLGFRGEAIPSIASVAKVTMQTSDGTEGTLIETTPDTQMKISDASLRQGTNFEIKELFFNTPARLKYLKSDRTEIASSIETIEHLAIGFPSIAFHLSVDGKEILSTTGRGNLLETISRIYGNEIAKKCLPCSFESEEFSFSGFVCHPSINYSNRYNMLTFMNNRNVYIPKVQRAVIDAYRDYLPPNRYPIVVLPIRVDYSLTDVNVHPTKKEVRLSCEGELANEIKNQIKISLIKTKGVFNEGQILKVTPVTLVESVKDLTSDSFDNSNFGNISQEIEQIEPKDIENLFTDFDKEEGEVLQFRVEDSHGMVEDTRPLEPAVSNKSDFPDLYPIGQIMETYIICDSSDGLYIVDQHAAAERINFEKSEREFNGHKDLVMPLFPTVVDIPASVRVNVDEAHIDLLAQIGIKVSPFGSSSLKVDEIPQFLADKNDESILQDIILETIKDRKVDLVATQRLAIATKACKMSIKANHILDHAQQIGLLKELAQCSNPLNCPHGRPTIIKISKYDLEKLFKRSGF